MEGPRDAGLLPLAGAGVAGACLPAGVAVIGLGGSIRCAGGGPSRSGGPARGALEGVASFMSRGSPPTTSLSWPMAGMGTQHAMGATEGGEDALAATGAAAAAAAAGWNTGLCCQAHWGGAAPARICSLARAATDEDRKQGT